MKPKHKEESQHV